MEFISVHQQNAGLDATKIHGNAVNDRVEELVEFEDRGDLLRRLLQGQQYVHAALLENCWGRGKGKRSGSAGHKAGLLRAVWLDSGPSPGMRQTSAVRSRDSLADHAHQVIENMLELVGIELTMSLEHTQSLAFTQIAQSPASLNLLGVLN